MVPDINNHDKVVAMLGKQVRVTLNRGGYPDPDAPSKISTGQLLGFGQGGDVEIMEDDGFVHYCWPMLDIELDTGEPE